MPLGYFGPFFTESHALLIPIEKNTMIDKVQFQKTYAYLMTLAKIARSSWEAYGHGEEMLSMDTMNYHWNQIRLDPQMRIATMKGAFTERQNSREIGLDGEDAFVKQSVIWEQMKNINFDQLQHSCLQYRGKKCMKETESNSDKNISARWTTNDGKRIDFLQSHAPAVLYLWFILEYCNLWETSAAAIPSTIAMTSFHTPSILNNSDTSSLALPSRKQDISILLRNGNQQHVHLWKFCSYCRISKSATI